MSASKNLMAFGLIMMVVCAYFAGAAEPKTATVEQPFTVARSPPVNHGAAGQDNPAGCGPTGCGHDPANPLAETSPEEEASGTPISYGALNHDNPRCGPNGCGDEQANPYHRSCEKENRCRNDPTEQAI